MNQTINSSGKLFSELDNGPSQVQPRYPTISEKRQREDGRQRTPRPDLPIGWNLSITSGSSERPLVVNLSFEEPLKPQ